MEPQVALGTAATATFFFVERFDSLPLHCALRRLVSKADGSKRAIPLAESGDAEVSRRRRETSIPWEQRTAVFVFGCSWGHRRRNGHSPRAQVLGAVKRTGCGETPQLFPLFLKMRTTATLVDEVDRRVSA